MALEFRMESNLAQQVSNLRLQSSTFDRNYFLKDQYSFEDIINKTAEPILRQKNAPDGRQNTLDQNKITLLIDSFQKLDRRFDELGTHIISECTTLQHDIAADEAAYNSRIAAAERELSTLQKHMNLLESRCDTITSFAHRMGPRLQLADVHRRRSATTADDLEHLAAFAKSEDLSTLPEIFNDDTRMEEAAGIASRLSIAANKVMTTMKNARHQITPHQHHNQQLQNQDGSLALPPQSPSKGPPPANTLAKALDQLELYRNIFDNKVISLFDTATEEKDFTTMLECVSIMSASNPQGAMLLLSRYISTRPMFGMEHVAATLEFIRKHSSSSSSSNSGRNKGSDVVHNDDDALISNASGFMNEDMNLHNNIDLDGASASGNNNNNNDNNNNNNNDGDRSSILDSKASLASSSSTKIKNSNKKTAALATDADALVILRALSDLYATLSSFLRNESVVIEHVFSNMPKAMGILVQRVFDQIVHSVLETVVQLPLDTMHLTTTTRGVHTNSNVIPPGAVPMNQMLQEYSPKHIRAHVKLLSGVYNKTLSFAEESVDAAGKASGLVPAELADAACGTALDRYLPMELAWLGKLGCIKLSEAKGTLRRDLVLDLLSMNEESVKRCIHVSPPEQVATAVRILFISLPADTHNKQANINNNNNNNNVERGDTSSNTTRGGASTTAITDAPPSMPISDPSPGKKNTTSASSALQFPEAGSLLQQIAAYSILGLGNATDRCIRRLSTSLQPPYDAHPDQAARSDAAVSFGTLLQAIAETSEIISLVHAYFKRVIHPLVAASPIEMSICRDGLGDMIAAVDDQIRKGIERTMSQITRRVICAMADQPKGDFKPNIEYGVDTAHTEHFLLLDTPTETCTRIVAMLSAIGEQARAHLHGQNLSSFVSELAQRIAAAVESHALRFIFTYEGALRWRRDVSEYAACISGMSIGVDNKNNNNRDSSARDVHVAMHVFDDVHALTSVLIVPPESLPGIIDGMPHIESNRVSKMVGRRADYKIARIGDRSLSSLIASLQE